MSSEMLTLQKAEQRLHSVATFGATCSNITPEAPLVC